MLLLMAPQHIVNIVLLSIRVYSAYLILSLVAPQDIPRGPMKKEGLNILDSTMHISSSQGTICHFLYLNYYFPVNHCYHLQSHFY